MVMPKLLIYDDANDAPNTAEDYSPNTTWLWWCLHRLQNIPILIEKPQQWPDAADDDDASPNDAVYPDSLIDSKLKRKLTPGQWLN